MYKIDETKTTEEGTVFETTINNTKMKTLFDTGAIKSVMSEMERLKIRTFG